MKEENEREGGGKGGGRKEAGREKVGIKKIRKSEKGEAKASIEKLTINYSTSSSPLLPPSTANIIRIE